MSVIKIEDLNKTYKERDIFKKLKGKKEKIGVENVSFSVEEGEIFSIIGLNGAGKTTIMKCLLGLLDYDSGNINIFGKGKLEKESKNLIGYLPEISYYPKSIKLKILMEYYSELYGIKDNKQKIEESLEKVGLLNRSNSRLEEFSKGMLQKVGIAQAILNSPKLLFLDEPMSGLDPLARREVIELLKELKTLGTTIFLNTHILGDIEDIGDRGIVVHKGKVLDSFNLYDKRKEEGYNIFLKDGTIHNVSIDNLDMKLKELKEITEIKKNHFSLEEYFKNTVLGGKE
jgi:ABC-2 type transport system ATP-binding protein